MDEPELLLALDHAPVPPDLNWKCVTQFTVSLNLEKLLASKQHSIELQQSPAACWIPVRVKKPRQNKNPEEPIRLLVKPNAVSPCDEKQIQQDGQGQ
ncbi:hypothetical protein ACFIOY_12505 [Bradyrhizobium sp. TZ2]